MYNITDVKPYVYQGIHKTSNKFYIGVRYGNVRIKKSVIEDFGIFYKTSCKEVKPYFHDFDWKILKVFDNKESALAYEDMLIKDSWNNPLLINKNRGGKKFHRPDNYVRGPKKQRKIFEDRSSYYKNKWKDPIYREQQLAKINKGRLDKNKTEHSSHIRSKKSDEWKAKHSIAMKKVSKNSKNICRVCRLSDRKEMTVQNFSRYPT